VQPSFKNNRPEALEERLRHEVAGIIPCYNAGDRLVKVVQRVIPLLDKVIVVDDGSTDGGVAALGALPVQLVRFPKNRGKGHALLEGMRAALTDDRIRTLCTLDADGQHNPAEVPGLYAAYLRDDADLLIGARVFDAVKVPWPSRIGNKMTIALSSRLIGARLPDTQCGFRLLSRRFAREVVDTVAGGRYETEMEIVVRAVRRGYRVSSAPIATIYEEGNRSSHFRKGRDSLLVIHRLIRAAAARDKENPLC
jgi:glycosyltransferase involved in cell wall biosynthesis